MSELKLLCVRPNERDVDFTSSRFVVSTAAGLNVNGQRLEMGDEIPRGALSAYALQCEYQRPLCHIELLSFALSDPDLREACARRGVTEQVDQSGQLFTEPQATAPPGAVDAQPDVVAPDISKMSRKELQELCYRSGLSTDGTARQLRDRLSALLD